VLHVCFYFCTDHAGSQQVSSLFFDGLARTYEFLTNQLSPIVLVGDANVRLDRPTDPSALRFNDLLVRLRKDLYCVEWGVKLYSLTQ